MAEEDEEEDEDERSRRTTKKCGGAAHVRVCVFADIMQASATPPSAASASVVAVNDGGVVPSAAEVYDTSRAAVGRPRRNIGAAGSSILQTRPSSVDGFTDSHGSAASDLERPRSEPSAKEHRTRGGGGGGSAAATEANKPLVPKKKPIVYQPWKSQRPSLSEQLATIGSGAAKIGAGISSRFGLEQPSQQPLLRTPAQTFVVGKLTAKHPSPVAFFRDRCTYSFYHPFQVRMCVLSTRARACVRAAMRGHACVRARVSARASERAHTRA